MEKPELTKLESLEVEAHHQREKRRKLDREREEKKSLLTREWEARIDAELDKQYGARRHELLIAEREAENAVLQEKERLAAENAPYPVGTKLVGWKRKYTRWEKNPPWIAEFTGVLEMVTRETEHPKNLGSYSRASVGEYIVRQIKKDGTPGLAYQKYRSLKWLPEGQKPKGAE